MIKNVIFDIGRVLINFDLRNYLELIFDDERSRLEVIKAVWESGWWKELDRGVIPEEEVIAKFRELAGEYSPAVDRYLENLPECFKKTDYAIDWVKKLKSEGYNVYYLSNYSEFIRRSCPGILGFIPCMDGGVFSDEVKLLKPDPAIYEALIKKYDLNPAECLFTDDVQANVDAARNLGFRAIRFDGYEKTYPVITKYLEGSENGSEIEDLKIEDLPGDGYSHTEWGRKI